MRTFLKWLRTNLRYVGDSPARIAALGGALVLGMGLGVPVQDMAYDYTWADQAFCNDCHVHDYANEAYERSIHAEVTTCHDCHRVPIRHYPRNLYGTLFDPPQGPEDIHAPEVGAVICAQCHSTEHDDEPLTGPMSESVREQVVKIDESPLHRLHMDADGRDPGAARGGGEGEQGAITCMDCHGAESNRAHRFSATSENCRSCHEGIDHGAHRMQQLECRECHFQGFIGR